MKSFFHQRRSYMTLLETLIAFSLLSLLLTVAFGIFRELSFTHQMTKEKQKESFQMRYVESRLGFIFERLVNENDTTRTFFFYSQPPQKILSDSPSLIFTFNNEVNKDPVFSGDVLARLYLDAEHRLCLALWPLHSSYPPPFQQEILLENVADLRYLFYAPPERITNANAIATEKIDPSADKKEMERDHWHSEWLFSYKQMPAILELTIQLNKQGKSQGASKDKTEPLMYRFVLPSSKNPIYYPPE